ncbi:acyl carrier protein [Flavobacteriaceae bacterium MAR_2009_75]|nr:acyl carrier protein [Flavobacteriaceae bacterium MAR_2009_75]
MDENIKYEKLRNIIKLYLPEDVSVEDVEVKSHLINDLNINSANLVDIVLDVEDEFDIMLENDDMDTMQTVEDALQIIDSKIANKNS